jgi:opacity protein-like surface antigen
MSRLIAISAILVFTGVGPVFAQDDELARDGIYLGFAVPVPFLTDGRDDISPGVGVRGGYRFHPHFAGEVQFEWFPSMDIEYSGVSSVELDMLTFTANAKGYLLTGRTQPFLLIGAGFMHFELDDRVGLGIHEKGDDFAARFGGGVEFYIDSNFVLTLDSSYVLPTGDADHLDHVLVALGLQYRF